MLAPVPFFVNQRTRWHADFNDPSVVGWASTAGYFVAALFAWRAGERAPTRGGQFERNFWRAICAAMIALGINKQLDLHVLVADIARDWSMQQGWYGARRGVQTFFMLAFVVGAGGALAAGYSVTRGRDPALRQALFGLVITAGYVVIRAASFHHTDRLFHTEIFGLRWNWLIEVAGFAIVALAARRYRAPGR